MFLFVKETREMGPIQTVQSSWTKAYNMSISVMLVEQHYNLCAKQSVKGINVVPLLFIGMFGGNINYANQPGVSTQGALLFKQQQSSVKTLKCSDLNLKMLGWVVVLRCVLCGVACSPRISSWKWSFWLTAGGE